MTNSEYGSTEEVDFFETPSGTPNFRTELAAQLSELIPEAIADGKVDVEKLKELLGDDVGDERERFGLFWPGKKRALKAAQEPTSATLRPDFANSKEWDTTKNVFIEGDNLEVLKILQKHYHGKIKMIYIDPPYNTGKDFVYPDNYKEGLDTYLEWTRQVNEEGKKVSTNSDSDGRYHSSWLNMMYPRLKLARNLLSSDGFIFLSISDVEYGHLKRICDEIFGEGNFVEAFIWQSIFRPSNLSKRVRRNAEYVLCYARDSSREFTFTEREEDAKGEASLTQNNNALRTLVFPKGSVACNLRNESFEPGEYGELVLETPLIVKDGVVAETFAMTGRFKWQQEYLDSEIGKGVHLVIKSQSLIPYYRKDYQQTSLRPTKILPRDLVGDVLAANAEVSALLGEGAFDYPKPTSLVRLLMKMVGTRADDIILDFFAGSGTTAHAVIEQNNEDGECRQFIQVQLPEPVAEKSDAVRAGLQTIADISRKRIAMASDRLALQVTGQSTDLGFRAYSLTDTNFSKWRMDSGTDAKALEQHLMHLRESADDDATPDSLLTEILLKQGYSLTEQISDVQIDGLNVKSVGGGLLLAYLDEHSKPTLSQLRSVLSSKDLAKFIMLEDAFQGDDELKTNLVQEAKSHGVELWTA